MRDAWGAWVEGAWQGSGRSMPRRARRGRQACAARRRRLALHLCPRPCPPQAPLAIAEAALLSALRARGVSPPPLLRGAAVQAVLLVTAHLFFFPPLDRAATTEKFTAAVVTNLLELAALAGWKLG